MRQIIFLIALGCLSSSAAFGQAPSWVWAKCGLNTATAVTTAVATDRAGNILVVGTYSGTISFGTASFTSVGQSEIFLLKYAPAGTLLWARNVRDSGIAKSQAVAADS